MKTCSKAVLSNLIGRINFKNLSFGSKYIIIFSGGMAANIQERVITNVPSLFDKAVKPVQMIKEKTETTQFFNLSKTNDNSDIIESCVSILHHGGVLAVPTDTIYGLACLAQSSEAVEKLYRIKGREESKPIAICVGESYDICQWSRFPQPFVDSISDKTGIKDEKIYQRSCSPTVLHQMLSDFFPGPVTMVTERAPALNTELNPKSSTVGIRVPDCDFIRNLANRLREPLALTSANFSGAMSSLCIEDFSGLWKKLDGVVDAGSIENDPDKMKLAREGSTVIRVLADGKSFKVLRTGCAYQKTVKTLQDKWDLCLVE